MHVNEIFTSIDGEINGFHQGRLSCFLRLQGCNLKCHYCDTKKAQTMRTGSERQASQILNHILVTDIKKITITGGEPMLQEREVLDLASVLVDKGRMVSIETNGSLPIKAMEGVSYVMDYKLPSSGESQAMKYENFINLGPRDIVKFVIADLTDYIDAINAMKNINMVASSKIVYAFSPVFTGDTHNGKWLFSLIKDDKLDVVFNLQLHKILDIS